MTNFRKAFFLAMVFAAISGGVALLYAVPSWIGSWQRLLLWIASLGCFGFLLGGIYAFDPQSDLKIKPSSFGRISFGIIASLLLSILWRWPFEGVLLAGLIGAVLGYFGMAWAKYVDF
ncbi:hypothetical protein [Rugamonas apoptosis]|uniref:Uncharacterized protein n=1 Tax=Rugamonas apoptosis TaxID=2758570 RepID=A0A7W2F8U9_9BURK|nr:hypothetical protein [Rugamonas apoptosis]MBA5687233.1 hypothetical protein [Rugamonas apoptosis]